MSRAPDLFSASRVAAAYGYHAKRPEPSQDDRDKRTLKRVLNRAAKGGLVNGMTKQQFRRRFPRKLPALTVEE